MMSGAHGLRRTVVAVVSLFCFLPAPGPAQENGDGAVINQLDDPLLQPFRWRSIGPVGQGGRVDDIAVSTDDPRVFFVGFATGGVWKTTNNGVTFRPVFDTYPIASVGDLAISPSNPDIVWVGTGESNNRQSSSFGAGVYKSTDGGETFTLMGLTETQSIARIIVHPTNPNVVWIAANGHLFGPNPERGVYKTTDGGNSWDLVLYVDENTGATDLVIDPSNPNTLFAATYQRRRTACCFVGGGPGSGIWRSDDAGETWSRVTGNGLPRGTMGRIGLGMTAANPNVVYAQIEVAADREAPLSPSEREEWERLNDGELAPYPQYNGMWRSNDKGRTWSFRSNENGRPMYFSQFGVDPTNPEIVYAVGREVSKSTDGGREFERLYGYGHVDQHAIWINPNDGNHLMIGNDGSVDVSYDQGEAWESLRGWAVGQPYHASVDMRRPYYVCTGLQDNGTWCGPSSVRTAQIRSEDWYQVNGRDGFYSAVDPTDYRVVYSESQGGNVGRVDLRTGELVSIRPRTPTAFDNTSNIVPAPSMDTEIRWNWNTPLILSPRNPRVVYVGGNRLFKSLDQGGTWTMSPDLTKNVDRDEVQIMGQYISLPGCSILNRGEECILSRNDGVSRYSTIVTIAESTLMPGLLWVGSDDGNVQVSRDGGATWTEVGQNVPGGTMSYYVSRVEASHFDPATAYISVDGHRNDDLRPYVFVTRDYGESWQSISTNLPEHGNVRTVRQDLRNRNMLYTGTEFGFYVSLDEGGSWQAFMNNLPTTRVDDVLVHPRDNDLVLATHGRSVFIMDDITALQALTPEILASNTHLFEPRDAVAWKMDRTLLRAVNGNKHWQGENAPRGAVLTYYLRGDVSGDVDLTITDLRTGEVFRDLEGTGEAGLNRVEWDSRGNRPPDSGGFRRGAGGPVDELPGPGEGPLAEPGVYGVTLSVNGEEHTTTITVLEDIWLDQR